MKPRNRSGMSGPAASVPRKNGPWRRRKLEIVREIQEEPDRIRQPLRGPDRAAGTRRDRLSLARDGLIMARRRATSYSPHSPSRFHPARSSCQRPDALHPQSLAQLPEAGLARPGLLAQRPPRRPDRTAAPGRRRPACPGSVDRGGSRCGGRRSSRPRDHRPRLLRGLEPFLIEFLGWKPELLELYRPVRQGPDVRRPGAGPRAIDRPEPPAELQHELGSDTTTSLAADASPTAGPSTAIMPRPGAWSGSRCRRTSISIASRRRPTRRPGSNRPRRSSSDCSTRPASRSG